MAIFLQMFDEQSLRATLQQAGLSVLKVERCFYPSTWERAFPIRLLSPVGRQWLRHLLQRLSLAPKDNAVFIGALCEVS